MTTNREDWIPPMEPGDEPLDPDILLITNYLGEELSAEEEAEVEKRLVEDEEFYEKALPHMRMWSKPVDFDKRLADIAAERARAQAARAPATTNAGRRVLDLAEARTVRLARWATRTRRRTASLIAAALLLILGPPFAAYQAGFSGGFEEGEHSLGPVTLAHERPGRGMVIHLREGARYVPEMSLPFEEIVGLTGEAYIEVAWYSSRLSVSTAAGVVQLGTGRYALKSRSGSDEETLVTVVHGTATMRGERKPDLVIRAGEFGRMGAGVAPARTAGGKDYPAPGPRW